MSFASAIDEVVKQTTKIGYRADAIRRNYTYSDIWVAAAGTRSVPLVAFTQTPPSYRSAAFGVVEGDAADAQALVQGHRALGAPLFLVIEGDTVSSWQVFAKELPRFIERFALGKLPEIFARNSSTWSPDVIHRAKSIGRVDPIYQLDFVDIGLIPAIEGEIHTKLDRLIREAVKNVRDITSNQSMRLVFRGVFRLLAAKILTDRQHPRSKLWENGQVADVLSAMGGYYSLGNDTQVWPANILNLLRPVWETFRSGFNVANISADDLAYVYESTLVTPQARAQFGTHSTPRHVADYILDRLKLWEFGSTPLKVYEPFAGAGVFLGSALRHMRDGLPHDWTDKQRHDLLIKHIGGSEIDPFACEVAKLSLILADYPNANGWQIEEADLFKANALADRVAGKDVILCNPPFEAFTATERAAYSEAWEIDGSKAVFALETALQAQPRMLGFVVPNTLLVDRRYLKQRKQVEKLYRDIELVSLPDGVFNVSQLDTALLIARDIRKPGESQRIQSSAIFDADKRRFAVDRKPSHVIHEERFDDATHNGAIWCPPLHHLWSRLAALPTLGSLVHGHWGLRWHGGQKETPRVFDSLEGGRLPGYMNSSALDQFSLSCPRYLDVNPDGLLAGGNLPWDAPKILANAGRLGRGYWRLAAAVDRQGSRASQQFIAIWPQAGIKVDLDATAALLNSSVINAFMTEFSFDKRFRIRTLESAPIPLNIPAQLGRMSRAYADAVRRPAGDKRELSAILNEMDALILEAYGITGDLKRDLLAAFGDSERPLLGLSSRRRRSQITPQAQGVTELPLFTNDSDIEIDEGEVWGAPLSKSEAEDQFSVLATRVPLEQWAGKTLSAKEVERGASINEVALNDLIQRHLVIALVNERGEQRFPTAQFEAFEPIKGIKDVLTTIQDAKVAWLWLSQPHVLLGKLSPLEALMDKKIEIVRGLATRDFS